MAVLELIDEQSGKLKFTGFESDAMEFTRQNPNCTYIIKDISNDKCKMSRFREQLASETDINS